MPEHAGNCDRELLKQQIRKLNEELRIRGLELQATKKLDAPGVIFVTSLISHRNQKPRVDIQVGEIHTQMDAHSAVDLARNLFEVAAGSYADAFLFNFLTETLKQEDFVGVQIIQDFRAYRDTLAEEFRKLEGEK
jgi:hypothetical protein